MMKPIAVALLALSLGTAAITAATPALAESFSLNLSAPKNSKAGKKITKANAMIGLFSGLAQNSASVRQKGKRNKAGIHQRGSKNQAGVGQFGNDHEAQVDQSGGNNSAGVLQLGNGSKCSIKQTGGQAGLCIGAGD